MSAYSGATTAGFCLLYVAESSLWLYVDVCYIPKAF
jgi:hypothetical protein